jgi:hypothetical protein
MSFLSDSFKFENFRLGHMWDQIRSHPQRLLFGAMMDPLSTWIENKTTGSHFDPQSDQLGGAYGGRVISAFGGGQQGGIYKQAQDAGINTSSGMKLENAAHIAAGLVGALYGGAAAAGAGAGAGGGAGAGAAGGLTEFTPAEIAAMGGGTASAGTGAGTGAAASSSPSWMQYARWANQARGLLGGGAPGGNAAPDAAEQERIRQQQIQDAIAQLGRLGSQNPRMPMSFINSPVGPTPPDMATGYMAQAPGGY